MFEHHAYSPVVRSTRNLLLTWLLLAGSTWAQLSSSTGWSALTNTKISSVTPCITTGICAGSGFSCCVTDGTTRYNLNTTSAITAAWSSAVFDTKRNRMIIWGGGHQDYYGNEIYALDLNTNTMSRITNPALPIDTGSGVEALAGGTQPNARHTYDGLAYIEDKDKMFVFGGSKAGSGNASNSTWLFNCATNTWEVTSPTGTIPRGDYGIVTAYDPNTGKVFLHDNNDLYSYDPTANSYTKLNNGGGIDIHCSMAIDPINRKLIIIGAGTLWIYDVAPGSAYVKTALVTSGGSAVISSNSPGIDYDWSRKKIVAWNGGNSVYSLDLSTNIWTPDTFTGGPTALTNGTFGRFAYVPKENAFITVNTTTIDASSFRLAPKANGEITTFQLTSTGSGIFPFNLGLGFKKGDATVVPSLSIPDAQVISKRTWNDGSLKHAVIAGQTTFAANAPRTITVFNTATTPGTALTASNIQTAAPSASVQCGAIGTVNLSSLLATPFRTWISGPEMVECHYRANVGADATLSVWFHVRLYKAGRIWIRAIVENGYLNTSPDNGHTLPNYDKSYVPTVTIGGTVVYSNGGSALPHYMNTRWSTEGWIGGNPAVTPKHDIQYLIDTKLVPNYWKRNPSATALNNLHQTYVPMTNGDIDPNLPGPGFQTGIGLLPLWDALYATSGDSRAYNSTLTNSSSYNSYCIVWRDSNTQLIAKPSNWPNYAADDGTFQRGAGAYTWSMTHEPSEGYTAYLITGDYWHYETMAFNASFNYLARNNNVTGAGGVNRILTSEVRGVAWIMRTNSQYAALCPTGDAVCAEYQTLLSSQVAYWNTVAAGLTPPGIGMIYEYGFGYPGGPGVSAPWQQHFWGQSLGMGSDIEPLANMTAYNQHRDYMYKFPIGILGDQANFYFTFGGSFNLQIGPLDNTNPTTFYTNWLQVWNGSLGLGFVSALYNNTLQGASGGYPGFANTGYWGNLMPDIAYAVDHGAPGAAASWNRMVGATNWNLVVNSGFDDIPIWGIVPRATVIVPPPAPPTGFKITN